MTLFVVGIIALRSSTGLTAVDIDHPGTFGVLEVLTMLGLGASVLVLFVPMLALGLVMVSLTRMARYDDAFGMTMLRLWALGATVWLGTLLVLVAVRAATVGSDRQWVGGTVLLVAVALVLFADVVDPEAFVVRHSVRLRNTIHCRRRVDGVTGLNLSVGTATGVRRAVCPTSSAGQLTGR